MNDSSCFYCVNKVSKGGHLILLTITLNLLEPVKPLAFYGGVLHGMFANKNLDKNLLHDDSYLVITPPYGWSPSAELKENSEIKHALSFGIVFHTFEKKQAEEWFDTFEDACKRGLLNLTGQVCYPTLLGKKEFLPEQHIRPLTDVEQVTIEWLTPTFCPKYSKPDEKGKRQLLDFHKSTPTLSTIINSTVFCIKRVNPELAKILTLNDENLKNRIPLIHHPNVTTIDHTRFVKHSYKNHYSKVERPILGVVGHAQYNGHIPADMLQILQLGQWFGVGQGAHKGQGNYRLSF